MNNILAFWSRRNLASKVVLLFLLLCVINWTRMAIVGQPFNQPAASRPAAPLPAAAPVADNGITFSKYNALSTGMSYADAVAVLGADGAEISSSELPGVKTVMYQWKAGRMANMNAMFQNDKLMSKAQFGLAD